MSPMRTALLLLSLLIAQGPVRQTEVEIPALGIKVKVGWRLQMTHGCRYTVPMNWTIASEGALATAPDGSTVTMAPAATADGPTYRNQLEQRFVHDGVVRQHDAQRLWIEVATGMWHDHYVVAADEGTTCIVTIEIRESSMAAEIARTIANSVGVSPRTWPR